MGLFLFLSQEHAWVISGVKNLNYINFPALISIRKLYPLSAQLWKEKFSK